MSKLSNPHDSFFRDSFSQRELAVDFCRNYLPAPITATLDPDPQAWELLADSYVDEGLGGHFADILYGTRLLDGSQVYVFLLVEHKSRPEPAIALQLLRYMVRIWEQDRREHPTIPLRPILPLVVYHGRDRWKVPTDFASLVDAPEAWRGYCPDFPYLLADFSRHAPPPTLGHPRLQARLLVLRAAFQRELLGALDAILDRLAALRDDGLRARELNVILLYLSATPAGSRPPGVSATVDQLAQSRGEPMVNDWQQFKDRLHAEGLEQGLEQGREEGREAGLRQGIALALEIKFGDAARDMLPRLEDLHDSGQLQALLDAVRRASRPEDLAPLLA